MKAVVLLSGGIDSTVALAHTQATAGLSFDYSQTHIRELDSARAIAAHYGIEHHVLDITSALTGSSALTTGQGSIPDGHAEQPDSTLVPGRNLVMLAVATAWAEARGFSTVVIGANADDRGGYPDCRSEFLEPLGQATRAGYGVEIWTPLLRMTKRQIIEHGRLLKVPLDLTWSCYRGGEQQCGRCGACESNGVTA
jgi:7-cyano-7-deazaguanine synthase